MGERGIPRQEEEKGRDLLVLVVEDSALDAELMVRELERFGYRVTWQRTDNASGLQAKLEDGTWDIVLSDFAMPHFNGLAAIEIVRAHSPDLPFILVSGSIGEETAVEAMQAGADDYLIKDRLARLGPAADRALRSAEQRQGYRKAQEELKASELKYRQLFDETPLPVVIFDRESTAIVDVNRAATERYGYSREEFLAMTVKDLRPPEEVSALLKGIAMKASDVHKVPFFTHRKKDGTLMDVVVSAHDLDINGRSCRLVLFTDITERRRAERALARSEKKFREMTDLLPQTVFEADLTGRITYVNRSGLELFGYTEKDVDKGMNLLSVVAPEDRPAAAENIQAILEGKPVRGNEYTALKADGSTFPMLAYSTIVEEDGKPVALRGIVVDMTEIKRAEEERVINESKFRAIYDQASHLAGIVSPEGVVLETNRMARDFIGKDKSLFIGKLFWETPWWEHSPDIQAELKSAVERAGQGEYVQFETTHYNAKGELRYIDFSIKPVLDRKGKVFCLIPEGRDITERKLSENALRESEELLRTTFNTTADGILVVDSEGRISHMNRQFLEMWRIPPEFARNADTQAMIDSVLDQLEEPDGFQARIKELDSSTSTALDEIRFKDGRVFERYSSAIVMGGKMIGRVHDFHDITKRKRDEEALRESEERHREIFNATSEAIFVQDGETGRILDVNETMLRMYGFDSFEEVRKCSIGSLSATTPEFTEEEALRKVRLAAEGHPQVFEWLARTRTGELFWVEVSLRSSFIRGKNAVLAVVRDISERKRAEQGMRLVQYGVDRARDGVFWWDSATRLVYVNEAACRSLGYSREELLSMKISDIDPDFPSEGWESHLAELRQRGSITFESRHRAKDGRVFSVEVTGNYVLFEGQEGSFAFARDITDRKQAEEERERLQAQLTQAQKMESIGRLAGGVAHDFNNMLAVITGYAEIQLKKPETQGTLRRHLEEIFEAGRRSADLTRQLLAFARKQTIAPKVLDLNDTVEGMLKMLRRLIGEDIDLTWTPGTRLWKVHMDPAQIDQILANLCVNSRDAIEGVGRICIETANVFLDASQQTAHGGVVPGEYIALTVSDNGCGMASDTIAQVFEPFFTTKGLGQGTGLGLATVYGIVKQNDGYINLDSEPGHGTTFRIYIPRHAGELPQADDSRAEELPRGHGEVILIVEDEPSMLEITRITLQTIGYTLYTASTPAEAMRIAREQQGRIDLLITDVIMPEMNGKELAERLEAIRLGLLCLFMSGYSADVIAHHGVLDEGVHFIQKPFSMSDLAVKVRAVLEGR